MEDNPADKRKPEPTSGSTESDEYTEYRDTSSGCAGALAALVVLVVGTFACTALAIHDLAAPLE